MVDRSRRIRLLLNLASVVFSFGLTRMVSAEPSVNVLNVDDSVMYQEMDGFGASFTDTSAWLFMNKMTADQRRVALRDLFDCSAGVGLSYLRQPMGSSDFRVKEDYTYDDMPAGETDYEMQHFNITHDEEYIIPLLKEVLAVSPDVKIMASPWTAPAWMKKNQKLCGGKDSELIDDDRIYKAYAEYFVKFIKAYAAHRIKIHAITLQNEPHHSTDGYPTMYMPDLQQAKLVKFVGKRFREEKISSRIIIWDHNWDNPDYPINILKDQEAYMYIDGTAFHAYAGNSDAQMKVHDAFPEKNLYFTECSGGMWAKDFGGNILWDTQTLVIGSVRNWAKTVVKWNMALDPDCGPKKRGGCENGRGVVTVNPANGEIIKNEEYYALGHAAKFVRPGARRIQTSADNSVGFVNSDGLVAVILARKNNEPGDYRIVWKGYSAVCSLPGRSVSTIVWKRGSPDKIGVWTTTGDKKMLLRRQSNLKFLK